MRLSFVVDAKNDSSTEQRRVFVGERSVVIVHFVPEALGSQTDTLAINLPDNTLNNNFVARHVQTLNGRSNLVHDVLSLLLGVRRVVLLVLEVHLDNFFNDMLDSGGIESIQNKG